MREQEGTSSKPLEERREERGGLFRVELAGLLCLEGNGMDSRVEMSSRPPSFVESRVLDNSDKK